TGGDSGPHKPVHERTTDSQFGTSHGRRHPTLPRANLSREEPDAGNPHVRVCEGWGRQRPHLLGDPVAPATITIPCLGRQASRIAGSTPCCASEGGISGIGRSTRLPPSRREVRVGVALTRKRRRVDRLIAIA